MEKLFLVDWGKDCDGARYAIIKSTEKHIGLHLDSIDNPSYAKYVEIDNGNEERFYIELPHLEIQEETIEGEVYSKLKCKGTYLDRFNTEPILKWKDAG